MKNQLTTGSGAPVPHDDVSRTSGDRGAMAADNAHLFEKLFVDAFFAEEKIGHTIGKRAFGFFEGFA